jgi:hypothetical protein
MISEATQKELLDEGRAADLLGVSKDELRNLSERSGLGRSNPDGDSGQRVFTYADLYRLCRFVVQPLV